MPPRYMGKNRGIVLVLYITINTMSRVAIFAKQFLLFV